MEHCMAKNSPSIIVLFTFDEIPINLNSFLFKNDEEFIIYI